MYASGARVSVCQLIAPRFKKIAKADELPVHNRKGVGNQKEKGGGDFEAGASSFSTLGHTLRVSRFSDIL